MFKKKKKKKGKIKKLISQRIVVLFNTKKQKTKER